MIFVISQLSIKNFAVIKELKADFRQGLNVLTGETGSGKSIIIEAISLALGSRADTTYVRTGCDKAVIQLVLDLPQEEEPTIFTREILASGKSVCRINDEVVTRGHMSQFCKNLVDIHGQYDHQSLLNPENHLGILDSCAKESLASAKESVAALYHSYAQVQKELSAAKSSRAEGQKKRSFLEFERNEIAKANLIPGEEEELVSLLAVQQNSEKIFKNLSLSHEALYTKEESAFELLGTVQSLLQEVEQYSPLIAQLSEVISDCYYKLEDSAMELGRFKDQIDFSPEAIDESISRLELINSLKRKYGDSIEEILAYRDKIEKELHLVENYDEILKELTSKGKRIYEKLVKEASALSEARKRIAEKIQKEINGELAQLNFKNAVFQVDFKKTEDDKGRVRFTENGFDSVEFLISTNKGEAMKPLAKIASGGEISRIMLAFKRILGDYDKIPTMIFDEIDSGISGQAAGVVGVKLAEIAKNHQVLCITHLPQIAVMGDAHYRISKSNDDAQTYTTIEPLTEQEKIQEIARLSGSLILTEGALKNAEEMLKMAKELKDNKKKES